VQQLYVAGQRRVADLLAAAPETVSESGSDGTGEDPHSGHREGDQNEGVKGTEPIHRILLSAVPSAGSA